MNGTSICECQQLTRLFKNAQCCSVDHTSTCCS